MSDSMAPELRRRGGLTPDRDQPGDFTPDHRDRIRGLRDDIAAFWRRMRTERVDHMLSPSQLQALGHLQREGAMSAARLAHFEQVTPQSISRTLAMLENQGMIHRGADPSDARATRVEITDAGRHTLALDADVRSQWLCELLEERCTAHEREMLFVAAAILRDLSR